MKTSNSEKSVYFNRIYLGEILKCLIKTGLVCKIANIFVLLKLFSNR